MVTCAFSKMHGLTTTNAARESLLLTLKTKCRTSYIGADMRGTPDQLMGLAMLVTDFAIARPACLR
jgi:hypothetical protein